MVGHPAEKNIARGLHDPLARDDPFALVSVCCRARVGFEDRMPGLLGLQDQLVASLGPVEEDKTSCSDTSDADDLDSDIVEAVTIIEDPALGREGGPVLLQRNGKLLFHLPFFRRMIDQRRMIDETPIPLSLAGYDRIVMFSMGRKRWFLRHLAALFQRYVRQIRMYQVGIGASIPLLEDRHTGKPLHRITIAADHFPYLIGAFFFRKPFFGPGDIKADRKALDIPLEGRGQCLVKIIDVEYNVAFGGGEEPKVQEMAVTTCLGMNAGIWKKRKVMGHDIGRSPEIGELAFHHPVMTDRYELFHPTFVRSYEDIERVPP